MTEEIILPYPMVSHQDIDNCVRRFKTIENVPGYINFIITAEQKVDDVDILLIAYLMLFKEARENLFIQLNFPHNTVSESKGLQTNLKLYQTYCYLMIGVDVFDFIMGKIPFKSAFKSKSSFTKSEFFHSRQLLPLLFISENKVDLFNSLFRRNPLRENSAWLLAENPIAIFPRSKDTFNHYKHLLQESANPQDRDLSVLTLIRISSFKILEIMDICSYYIASLSQSEEQLKKNEMQCGLLPFRVSKKNKKNESYEYFATVKGLITDLSGKPFIYQLLFCQILSNSHLPQLKSETQKEYIKSISSLWKLTKKLAIGLTELGLNIIEHATTHKGFICGRIIKIDKIPIILNSGENVNNIYKKYLNSLVELTGPDLAGSFDIHIADLGTKSIIDTLENSTSKLEEKPDTNNKLRKLLKEDIKTLLDKKTTLYDFLSTTNRIVLHQQMKKSIAHFGLLTFSKNINDYNGLIMASSSNAGIKPLTAVIPNLNIKLKELVSFGTRYSIIFPLIEKEIGMDEAYLELEVPIDASVAELKGLESLFKIKTIKNTESAYKPQDVHLYSALLPDQIPVTDDDENELWQTIRNQVSSIIYKGVRPEKMLLNLNLENLTLSGSQIIRLLATIEHEYPNCTPFVSNITTDCFNEVIETNDFFYELYKDKNYPYWNNTSVALFLHYILIRKNEYFYFTDCIGGSSLNHFYRFNKLIDRNHFNLTSIQQPEKTRNVKQPEGKLPALALSPAFYNKSVLLPFDLIIKGKNSKTIFENNSHVLLMNPIKPNLLEK